MSTYEERCAHATEIIKGIVAAKDARPKSVAAELKRKSAKEIAAELNIRGMAPRDIALALDAMQAEEGGDEADAIGAVATAFRARHKLAATTTKALSTRIATDVPIVKHAFAEFFWNRRRSA